MRYWCFLIFLLALIGFGSCGTSSANSKAVQAEYYLPYDTSRIAVLVYDFRMTWPFDSTYQPTTLNALDFNKLDSLIKIEITRYNSSLDSLHMESFGIDTAKFEYKRQYLPVLNNKGEKLVWAIFFCRNYNRDWKRNLFLVDDGGNCYFNLIVNITTGKSQRPFVNGYAHSDAHNMGLVRAWLH